MTRMWRRSALAALMAVTTLGAGIAQPTSATSVTTAVSPVARAVPDWVDPYDGLYRAIGTDTIAVYVCRVPVGTTDPNYVAAGGKRLTVTPLRATRFGNDKVAPYYRATSFGRYKPVFVARGYIDLANDEGPQECLERATESTTGDFTNVLAVDNSALAAGLAGPGLIGEPDWFTLPPAETERGAWVGGQSIVGTPAPTIVVHELGHTLHWPHSYRNPSNEYDNPLDLMSSNVGAIECSANGLRWPCKPKNTLAYNRYLSGWVNDTAVRVHTSGTTSLKLAAPTRTGVQLLIVPSTTAQNLFLTLEARPATGNDAALGRAGVAVHFVNERPEACGEASGVCPAFTRRQGQVVGANDSYKHVVRPKTKVTFSGVTIAVGALTKGRYPVTVTGSFTSGTANWGTQRARVASSSDILLPAPAPVARTVTAPAIR